VFKLLIKFPYDEEVDSLKSAKNAHGKKGKGI